MPFIPHTEADVKAMLDVVGAKNIDELFDEIPAHLRSDSHLAIPERLSEMELNQLVEKRIAHLQNGLCFLGAGAYEHHIPAAVWDIASRGEFLTAYTPYQAEASQGTLQLLYEFQTMIAALTGMDVANASLYDGASALAEAVLMAVRLNKKTKSKQVLMLGTVHPHYAQTVRSIVRNQNIELVSVPFSNASGTVSQESLHSFQKGDFAAIVIQQPNFFGQLECVDTLTDWAHANDALVIATVNPMALALLKEPGQWGQQGADIACGEGQPLGIPLASGGPYFGFLTCRKSDVRQMPGRLIGKTVDSEGKVGFSLTLQAREQHIRRSKATSNICTNQGLMTTAATVYMSLLGHEGLAKTAKQCHYNTQQLIARLTKIKGVSIRFNSPFFHETVIEVSKPASEVLSQLLKYNIAGGLDLGLYYPELKNAILLCVTETKIPEDLISYADALNAVLNKD